MTGDTHKDLEKLSSKSHFEDDIVVAGVVDDFERLDELGFALENGLVVEIAEGRPLGILRVLLVPHPSISTIRS